MNWTDYLLIAMILLAVGLAVRKCVKDHKKGRTCGCDCASCGHNCGK